MELFRGLSGVSTSELIDSLTLALRDSRRGSSVRNTFEYCNNDRYKCARHSLLLSSSSIIWKRRNGEKYHRRCLFFLCTWRRRQSKSIDEKCRSIGQTRLSESQMRVLELSFGHVARAEINLVGEIRLFTANVSNDLVDRIGIEELALQPSTIAQSNGDSNRFEFDHAFGTRISLRMTGRGWMRNQCRRMTDRRQFPIGSQASTRRFSANVSIVEHEKRRRIEEQTNFVEGEWLCGTSTDMSMSEWRSAWDMCVRVPFLVSFVWRHAIRWETFTHRCRFFTSLHDRIRRETIQLNICVAKGKMGKFSDVISLGR